MSASPNIVVGVSGGVDSSVAALLLKKSGADIADGKPGPMSKRLREIYIEFARATAA